MAPGTPTQEVPRRGPWVVAPPASDIQNVMELLKELRSDVHANLGRQEQLLCLISTTLGLQEPSSIPERGPPEPPTKPEESSSIPKAMITSLFSNFKHSYDPTPAEQSMISPPELRTCLGYLDMKKRIAALESKHNCIQAELRKTLTQFERTQTELKGTQAALKETHNAWDAERVKNIKLTQKLSAETAKLSSLQKLMVRAGRSDDTIMDADIQQGFMGLRNEVYQFAKRHMDLGSKSSIPGNNEEMKEHWLKHRIAGLLHQSFFTPDKLPLGHLDVCLDASPFRQFYLLLAVHGCDEKLRRDWRVATVKAAKYAPCELSELSSIVARRIWDDHILCFIDVTRGSSREAAWGEFHAICESAARLALVFSGSSIEYSWEQGVSTFGTTVDPSRHEVVAKYGAAGSGDQDVLITVFGGVVRGDKTTGLLANGATRLSLSQVVTGREGVETGPLLQSGS